MIGEDAIEQSRTIQRREDRNWITSNEYYRLFIASMSMAKEDDVNIVTGLPVAFYDDKEILSGLLTGASHKFIISGSDERTVNVKQCRVIPQPFGTVIDFALDDNGNIQDHELANGVVGVLDIGGKTTNILTVTKLSERVRQTTSVNVGGWNVVRAMRTYLDNHYPDMDMRDHEVQNAVMNGEFKYFGETVDISQIVREKLATIASQIIDEATQLWNGGAGLDRVIITGGGALVFGSYILPFFRHAMIAREPIFANARGYLKLANRIAQHAT